MIFLQVVVLHPGVEGVHLEVVTCPLQLLHQVKLELGVQALVLLKSPHHPPNLLPPLSVPFVKSGLRIPILCSVLRCLITSSVSLAPGTVLNAKEQDLRYFIFYYGYKISF